MAGFLALGLTSLVSLIVMLLLAVTIGQLPNVPGMAVVLFAAFTAGLLVKGGVPKPRRHDLIRLEFTPPQAPTSMRMVQPFSSRIVPVGEVVDIAVIEHRLRPHGEGADTDAARPPGAGVPIRVEVEVRAADETTWSAEHIQPDDRHRIDAVEVVSWLRELLADTGVAVTTSIRWTSDRPRGTSGSWTYGGSGSANAGGFGGG
jgi:hypothetical protein